MSAPPPVTVSLGGRVVIVGGATLAEQQAKMAEILEAFEEAEARKRLVRQLKAGWEQIKADWDAVVVQGQAWLAATPPATDAQRIVFLYNHLRFITEAVGQLGGDLHDVGDALMLVIDATDGLLDEGTLGVFM